MQEDEPYLSLLLCFLSLYEGSFISGRVSIHRREIHQTPGEKSETAEERDRDRARVLEGRTARDWRLTRNHGPQNHRVGLAVTRVLARLGNNRHSLSVSPGSQPNMHHRERRSTPGVCRTAITDFVTAMNRNEGGR